MRFLPGQFAWIKLARSPFTLEEHPFSFSSSAERLDAETGYITGEMLERRLPEERFTRFFFICGPPPMMEAVHEALLEHGVPEAHVQIEKFELA